MHTKNLAWKGFLALFLVLLHTAAGAHYPRESYIYLTLADEQLGGRFEMTLDDLGKALPLDADGNGAVSREEFEAGKAKAYGYVEERLAFHDATQRHAVTVQSHRFVDSEVGTFAFLEFEIPTLGTVPESLDIDFEVPLAGIDDEHKSRLLIERNDRTGVRDNEAFHALMLEQGAERQSFSLVGLPWFDVLLRFTWEGMWHIWIGLDHVLFLVALLLVASMHRDTGTGWRWQPVKRFQSALFYVAKVITVFTVAHSVTLCLAALDILQLPVTPVEVVIAASIAVAALHNLRPLFGSHVWVIVFVFGLVHGFGFANVLMPLGLSATSLATGLAGFNIGVEVGQLAIVLVLFQLLFALRYWSGYQPVIVRGGSVALILVALFWVVERSYGWWLKQDFTTAMHALSTGIA